MIHRAFGSLLLALLAGAATRAADPITLSVYATAGDVLQHLGTPESRARTLATLRPLRLSRIFLEGRRGDEYVPPSTLREARHFFLTAGLRTTGGIATVPGSRFGVRQDAALGWLNWQSAKTQQDVARFFTENAPIFEELIVDDFYCTADTSAESEAARGPLTWEAYRRDLLVSLIEPMMIRPARTANPGVRLILKFPQWYDRFHRFGYAPERMAPPFDQIWVGTEVRDPQTRRMGFVQPTEGYMNFRWLTSVAGSKVIGAWFDHIECGAAHFVDQAYQSVLAGARELTLFRLGDVMERHPGNVHLAERLPDLIELAGRVVGQPREGVAYYKPPGSDPLDDGYLADYLGMLGWPVLPVAYYPENARVAILAGPAASEPNVLRRARSQLAEGATLIVTPAFLRAAGPESSHLAGVTVASASQPTTTPELIRMTDRHPLPVPWEMDGSLTTTGAQTQVHAATESGTIPWLTEFQSGRGRVFVLNVRTFAEADFLEAGEWLLAPRPLGLSAAPQAVADTLRQTVLAPLDLRLEAPVGVAIYRFAEASCLYNFHNQPVAVRLGGIDHSVPAKGWIWQTRR